MCHWYAPILILFVEASRTEQRNGRGKVVSAHYHVAWDHYDNKVQQTSFMRVGVNL